MDLRELRAAAGHDGARHPWERARLRVVSRLLRAHGTPAPAVVVDVGCGDGFVVGELARRFPGTAFAAVDPNLDDDSAALLRRRAAGLPITVCRSLDEASSLGPADIVLLLDVIEHVEDDAGFLERLRHSPVVGPRTLLVVTVPAHQRLFGPHDVFLRHVRRYDPPVLTRRLEASGFQVQQAGEFFFGPLLARRLELWRAAGAADRGPGVGVAGWRGGRLLTRALAQILWLDFAWSAALRRGGLRLPGLSAYALCRPSAS